MVIEGIDSSGKTTHVEAGASSAVTFNPSLIITALRTVRILGINSTAQNAPEKLLDTVMPVPEEFLLTELWYCNTLGRNPIFQQILMRIQATPVYANMAMVHRLCPAMALTPINAIQSYGTGILNSEKGAIKLMQSMQWIYERGMSELQDAAVEYFHDIPVQIGNWDWSDKWSYPVVNCQATPYEYQVDEFRSLQQLSEHVKTTHDVTFYSSTTHSCQQVLCGRLVKAAHMWLNKENQTFGKTYPKERKIKRKNKGGPSDLYLDMPIETLVSHETPVPPKLTPEKVERGPIVRPEYPTTLLAVQNLDLQGIVKMSVGLSVQEWSMKAAHGLLGSDPTEILRQVYPIYSPVDLYPGPSGETPSWWFTPYDAKMIIRLAGTKTFENDQKILFSLFNPANQGE